MAEKRVLVTGGGTFLGDNIAAALLAEGAEISLLVRPENEGFVDGLRGHAQIFVADAWDPASLRGRARGHQVVINTVGSMSADPEKGLTHQRLNFVSARNIANMCVSDGVPHLILLSAANALWINNSYIRSKREAESYAARVGLDVTIIRAPMVYVRGKRRPLFYQLVSVIGSIPPLSWVLFRRSKPMPVDVAARAIARIALRQTQEKKIYYGRDLRKLNSRAERRGRGVKMQASTPPPPQFQQAIDTSSQTTLDENTPFGWSPTDRG